MTDNDRNIFELLTERARGPQGEIPAIHWLSRTLRWDQVEQAAREVAGGLVKLGVNKGDRIAVMLPNVPPYLFLQYASHLIGAILVPIHEYTKAQELGYLLEDSEAKFLFYWGDNRKTIEAAKEQTEVLAQCVEVGSSESDPYDVVSWMEEHEALKDDPVGGGDDTAIIRYTAGVTGRSKGAMLSHKNILYVANETERNLRIFETDTVLGGMPFYHPFGSTLQLQMLLPSGAALNMHTSFDPVRALEDIRHKRVTIFVGLPVHFAALVDEAGSEEEIGKLRFAICGGGPLDMSVMTQFERHFKTRIATVYGVCEASPTIAVNPHHRVDSPSDALGRAISGTDIRIVNEDNEEVSTEDVGEIVVRGPGIFNGYWNKPNATSKTIDEDGWFHTDDLGKMDIEGWVYGVGRLLDRINKGGFSVYPREVEQVLNAHPSIHESAVVGVPDRHLGEEIEAYVVVKTGHSIAEKELIDYSIEQLARYKAPRRIHVIESLPRSANGSVLRRKLREY